MILQISFGDVSNIIQLWLPIAISVLSFILSICNAWKNKKVLDVEIEEEYSIISNVYKDDAAVLSNIPSYTVPKGYIGIVIYIKVVNPSPSDIAFFDLRILNENLDQLIPQLYRGNLSIKPSDEIYSYADYLGEKSSQTRLNLLDSNYGVFKSNSFKRIELVAVVPESNNKITVTFKIAKNSLRKSKFSSVRKRFKSYRKTFYLTKNNPNTEISVLGISSDKER